MNDELIRDEKNNEGPVVWFADRCLTKRGPSLAEDLLHFVEAHDADPVLVTSGVKNIAIRARLEAMMAMDVQTIQSAHRLVGALCDAEPILFEGEPATSKTSIVRYVAALAGWPLVRVNFSANAREEGLFGSFLPDGSGERLWRWVSGPVAEAPERGCILLLDEPNLAPPGVLDRLLSMCEQPPTLRLLERDGREIEFHGDFRVVVTQNPEDHAGRRPLSSAFRDRFSSVMVAPPAVESLRAAMRHWIDGRVASAVTPDSDEYSIPGTYNLACLPQDQRLCPALAKVKSMRRCLMSVADVVYTLGHEARAGTIGRDRVSPLNIGRRQLAAFAVKLDKAVARGLEAKVKDFRPLFLRSVQEHFLLPFYEGGDRKSVRKILNAEGLLATDPLPLRAKVVRREAARAS